MLLVGSQMHPSFWSHSSPVNQKALIIRNVKKAEREETKQSERGLQFKWKKKVSYYNHSV